MRAVATVAATRGSCGEPPTPCTDIDPTSMASLTDADASHPPFIMLLLLTIGGATGAHDMVR